MKETNYIENLSKISIKELSNDDLKAIKKLENHCSRISQQDPFEVLNFIAYQICTATLFTIGNYITLTSETVEGKMLGGGIALGSFSLFLNSAASSFTYFDDENNNITGDIYNILDASLFD
jgi:hypothetical protein